MHKILVVLVHAIVTVVRLIKQVAFVPSSRNRRSLCINSSYCAWRSHKNHRVIVSYEYAAGFIHEPSFGPGSRQAHLDLGSLPNHRSDFPFCSDLFGALAHVFQASMTRLAGSQLRIEALSIVGDSKTQSVVFVCNQQPDRAGVRMPDGVVHAFLRDPQQLLLVVKVIGTSQ